MSEKYIIGIDEGSQSAKITIFDTKGNIICEDKEPLRPYDLPKPGYVEQMTTGGTRSVLRRKNVWRGLRAMQRISLESACVRYAAAVLI